MTLREVVTGENEEESVAWYNLVGQFRQKAQEFQANFDALLNRSANVPPEYRAEYNQLVNVGVTVKAAVQKMTSTIDSIVGFFDSFTQPPQQQLDGLGLLPILPIAGVIAAVGFMAKWTYDYLAFDKKLLEFQRLQSEENLSPQQAANVIRKLEGQTAIAEIFQSMTPVLLLGGAFLLTKFFGGKSK